jgi:hypothetical protein
MAAKRNDPGSGVGLAVALAVALAGGRPAQACKCGVTEADRLLLPASGTKAFPTDGRIRVFLTGFPPSLRARMGEEYRLRDGAGQLVPLDATTEGTMLTLVPRSTLRPRSRYTVERVFAYERGSRTEAVVNLTRLDEAGNVTGTVAANPAPANFLALARTARGVVAAWDHGHAGIELAWLGPDGRPANGVAPKPVSVSAGSGSDSSWPLLAPRGELVAVSWIAGRNERRTFLAVADGSGAVSDAVAVAAGHGGGGLALAADDQGVVAVYGRADGPPQVERFRCLGQPPPAAALGAPQRLPVP